MEILTEHKQQRCDLRMTFRVKYYQVTRLIHLGLTCDRLHKLFDECESDEFCFKTKLKQLGVYSEPLRNTIAAKLVSDLLF